MDHEVFVHVGPNYYYTEQKRLWAGTQPVVRVKPSIPIRYESKGWDFGWLLARTGWIPGPLAGGSLHPQVSQEPGPVRGTLVRALKKDALPQ